MKITHNNIRLFGIVGLIASTMVGIGEFMIHFNLNNQFTDVDFGYFIGIPEKRLLIGHYLMIFFIPLYVLGYWHLYLALRSGSENSARAVLILGIFAFMIGGIWVGSRANLGIMIQTLHQANVPAIQTKLIATYQLYLENLVQILRVLILLISIIFVWVILKGNTLYSNWMAFFNPITILIFIFMTFFFIKPVGQYLVPAAMNVAHFVLFSASLIALRTNNLNNTNKNI